MRLALLFALILATHLATLVTPASAGRLAVFAGPAAMAEPKPFDFSAAAPADSDSTTIESALSPVPIPLTTVPIAQDGSVGRRVGLQLFGGIPIEFASELVGAGLIYNLGGNNLQFETYCVAAVLVSALPTSLAIHGIGVRARAGRGELSTTTMGALAGAAAAVAPFFVATRRDRETAAWGGAIAALVTVPLGAVLAYHNSTDDSVSTQAFRMEPTPRTPRWSGAAIVPARDELAAAGGRVMLPPPSPGVRLQLARVEF